MKLIFMGTPAASVPSLAALVEAGHEVAAVWTQPDKPAGRGRRLSPPPVKIYALEKGIPVHQPKGIRNEKALAEFESYGAEAAVVVAYGKILPPTLLEAFPRGCINVHFSLLPKYRGAAPVTWAIANGEKVTGVTTMMMDEGLDTGDILLKRKVTIRKDETADELTGRLAHAGADLIVETIYSLDQLKPKKQNDSKASFAPLLAKEDGRIDWKLKAGEISRRIRAFQPYPRSFTSSEAGRITIWKGKPVKNQKQIGEPGTILKATKGKLVIACGGNSALRVFEIQQEGKRKMQVDEFLNGSSLGKGDRLGLKENEKI